MLVGSPPSPVGFQLSAEQHDPFSRLVAVLSPGRGGRVGERGRDKRMEGTRQRERMGVYI